MSDPSEPEVEPLNLRFLRRLVTALTLVMIGGVVLIITLLVIRLNEQPLNLPESLVLPDGAEAASFTQGRDWIAVITKKDEVLIYDRLRGTLRQRMQISP